MGKILAGLSVAVILGAGAVAAEPIDTKTAKKLLFKPSKAEIEILPQSFLSDGERAALRVKLLDQNFQYYGAFAVSPAKGAVSLGDIKGAMGAINHHSLDAARAAALAGCNAERNGGGKCVIVGLVRPAGWSETGFQLSSDATLAFRKKYRGGGGPKAFAISPKTGEYAFAKGDDANKTALVNCNAAAKPKGASDCEIVIQN